MDKTIQDYNHAQVGENKLICRQLAEAIQQNIPSATNKVWHGGPVWFLNDNPIVGYWVRKDSVQLLFWSGQSFDESGLMPEGKFKAAEAHFTKASEINVENLRRWLEKAQNIQWDYKNIVKRKGDLERLK